MNRKLIVDRRQLGLIAAFILLFIQIFGDIALAQSPKLVESKNATLDARKLAFCSPFLESSKDLLECSVSLEEGEISIILTLKNILMTPRSDSSSPPEDLNRDWSVYFFMCPKLSLNDLAKIRDYVREREKLVKSKSDTRLLYNAEITTDGHWFRVRAGEYHPVRTEDLEKMKQFVERLASRCKTIEGENPLEFLMDRLVRDPLLDGKE